MTTTSQSLDALQDIKRIMEKSGRFISLSGWSGISAGLCGLAGAAIAVNRLASFRSAHAGSYRDKTGLHMATNAEWDALVKEFCLLAAVIFIAAFISAFIFTYLKSRKEGIAIWGSSARRLLWNTLLPIVAGGFVVLRLLYVREYLLIAPCCLIFYGLGLVNGSKYTLGEVRYLGYFQLALGLISLWLEGYGLLFWALGFGIMHIIYGTMMWLKYERNQ